MALPVGRLEEFIITLGRLRTQRVIDDVIAFGDNLRSKHLNDTYSIQEFYAFMQMINCSSIGIKLSRKLRYEKPLVLNDMVDFKVNRKSLVVTICKNGFTDEIRYKF